MKLLARQKAQSISEYVVLVSIVSFALIGMSLYIKRGIQAAVKDTADIIGDQVNGGIERDVRVKVISKGPSIINETVERAFEDTTFYKGGGKLKGEGRVAYREGVLGHVVTQEKE